MRHQKQKFTLGREKAAREALLRGLAENLVLNESIRTTRAKARALRIVVEPLVTKAKKGTLTDRRNIKKVLYTEKAVKKMMDEIGPRYKERAGGFTRIIKLSPRTTDSAEMVRIEFV